MKGFAKSWCQVARKVDKKLKICVVGYYGKDVDNILIVCRKNVDFNHYYMAELILLKSNWAAQNHDILPLSFLLPLG